MNTAQLFDGAITPAKLAMNSVTTEKIATNSITADKLNLSDAELHTLVKAIKEYLSKPVEEFDWTVPLSAGTCLEMIWCDHGTFTMGSPSLEDKRESDEDQHEVTLTKGFWLGKYQVTQAQWYAVLGTDPSYFKGSQRPVEQVSYNDALTFCRRLTEKERAEGRLSDQYEYRLPTEAQWEYACRAGTKTALNNGTESNFSEVAWYNSNAGGVTHIVGQRKPNAWGFYDMPGNVWEWCLDWYNENYYRISPKEDPVESSTGSARAMRGGSFDFPDHCCRSADRGWCIPTDKKSHIGFRIALVSVE